MFLSQQLTPTTVKLICHSLEQDEQTNLVGDMRNDVGINAYHQSWLAWDGVYISYSVCQYDIIKEHSECYNQIIEYQEELGIRETNPRNSSCNELAVQAVKACIGYFLRLYYRPNKNHKEMVRSVPFLANPPTFSFPSIP